MQVHFIAIGGAVMHQLAIALKNKGYQVTGSDDEIFDPARTNLLQHGLLPASQGWFPEKITPQLDAVILGMHAREDNPELIRARELGLKIYSFPEYVFQESLDKKRVAIGGSHGKTTITSMVMHVLRLCGQQFDYLVGARLDGFDFSVSITDAPVIICEADEYPASTLEKRPKFHFLKPQVAVLSGVAWDHINVFPTFEIYKEQFAIFLRSMPEGGILFYNAADDVLCDIVAHNSSHIQAVPYYVPAHEIDNGVTTVKIDGITKAIKVFGRHNLMNLEAARLVCAQLGVSTAAFLEAIASFTGAAKRLELLAAGADMAAYRDFAHAPSKVKATITATRQQYPDRKLVGCLELHTYSSLNEKFLSEYHEALNDADVPVVFFSKHALELKRLPMLTEAQIREGFGNPAVKVFSDPQALSEFLQQQFTHGSNLLLMSSGTFDGMALDPFKTLAQS
jgi:UDP-N-acetylmuramate: L-alanyl-gamma-D-glutamyl-meso-diaminopimelate ligase